MEENKISNNNQSELKKALDTIAFAILVYYFLKFVWFITPGFFIASIFYWLFGANAAVLWLIVICICVLTYYTVKEFSSQGTPMLWYKAICTLVFLFIIISLFKFPHHNIFWFTLQVMIGEEYPMDGF